MNRKGRYGQFIRGIFTTVDFVILNIVYILTALLTGSQMSLFSKPLWLILNLSFIIVLNFSENIHNKRVVFADKVILLAFKLVLLHAAVFSALLTLLPFEDVSLFILMKLYAMLFIAMSSWWIISRKMLKRYRTKGFNFKRIIIIGGGTVGVRLLNEMISDAGYGYRIVGFFDDNKNARTVGNYKGTLADVEKFVSDNLIDEMYCTVPDNDDSVSTMIKIAERNAVDFYYVPQFSRNLTRRFELESIGNVPIMALRPNPLSRSTNRGLKRLFDFTLSSLTLILSPIILIPVAIGIKISSPGPIFFKQKRTGYRGSEFTCYKFRTMKVNNDSDKLQASKNDPRKTKFGNFLRKSSIDELPQIFNVWRGDMSFVGPRPHMVKHTKDYSALIDKYMIRHTIKPGITGWAQVNGYRGETKELWQMEKRVEFDVWYTENWSIPLDLKIIFKTFVNAIRGEKNAF